jgi:hypothetical protein
MLITQVLGQFLLKRASNTDFIICSNSPDPPVISTLAPAADASSSLINRDSPKSKRGRLIRSCGHSAPFAIGRDHGSPDVPNARQWRATAGETRPATDEETQESPDQPDDRHPRHGVDQQDCADAR